MKQHFITVRTVAAKNKANKEIQEMVMKYNNCLIDDQNIAKMVDKLYGEAAFISAKNSRCEKLRIDYIQFVPGHQSYFIEGNFHMSITEVKRFELSNHES